MSASIATETWIHTTLTTGASSLIGDRVYSHIAPEDATYPYILFQALPGTDVMVNGAYRVQSNLKYLIKAVTQGGKLSDLDTIVDKIYELLHAKGPVTVTGGLIQSSVITGIYTPVETTDDTYYPIRGLFIRISAT